METTSHLQSDLKRNTLMNRIHFDKQKLSIVVDSGVRKIIGALKSIIITLMISCLGLPKVALALVTDASKIKGWDIYGRVPNDDWLFSSWRLTDPNLFKRTLAETVKDELPSVFGNFKRRKSIMELMKASKSLAVVAAVLVCGGLAYKNVVDKKMKATRKSDGSPTSRSTSAIAKAGPTKGAAIDFMGAGWYDMEQNEPAGLDGKKNKKDKKQDNTDDDVEDDEDGDKKDGDKDKDDDGDDSKK